MKLSYKVALVLILYSTIIVSFLSSGLYYHEQHDLKKEITKEIGIRASRLQAEIISTLKENDAFEIQRELSWVSALNEIFCVFVTDEENKILYAGRMDVRGRLAMSIMPYYDELIAANVRSTNMPVILPLSDSNLIGIYYPLDLSEQGLIRTPFQKMYTLFIVYDTTFKQQKLEWHYLRGKLFILFSLAMSVVFLIFFLNRHLSSRIQKLIHLSEEFANFNYKTRVSLKGNDEINQLNTNFNQMAERIQAKSYDLEQQNNLYNALAETNQIIARTTNPRELLEQVCQVAINTIGLESAWVILSNSKNNDGSAEMISVGNSCECSTRFQLSLKELKEGKSGLISKVWFHKKPLVMNNFNPNLMPFYGEKNKRCKVLSTAIFPLFQNNQVVGVLTLCSSELNFFTPKRLQLCEKIISDVCSALDNLELKTSASNERELFKKIGNSIPVMILLHKVDQPTLFANYEFERLMGFKPEKNWENIQQLRALFARTDEMRWHDYNMLSCYGETIDTSWALINLADETQVAIGIDLTDRKKSESSIKRLAYFDPLTDLPNRRYWNEFANEHLSFEKNLLINPLVLLCLDLDRFKIINDTRGHDVGDKLLVHVAERLKTCVHGKNMLARLGGDEFAFLLLNARETEAVAIARQIVDVLHEPFVFDKYEIRVSVSIGIACAPQNGNQLETLYKSADIAMYYAKQERIGYAFFEEKFAKKLEEDFYLEQSLEQALSNEELYLVYQPRVDLADEKITSVEALLRWKHPERGEISPDVFIILAEQSHIIYDIDDFVLREACNQIKNWKNKGLEIRLAINLSVKAFQRDNLFERIQNILLETGVRGEWLEIEITESAALYDLSLACKILLKIKELGIHLSIDDFGTGYSSLNYLKSLPVDSLKVDCSLIKDVEKPDSMNHKIVPSILFIAKNLGLKVVAEGVETLEQKQFLKELGCESVQGFYYTKGVLPEKLEELAEEFHWFKV
jgi:diguanylate cyclase (GGDEF)-like protein